VRLLVKEVLVDPERILIRHSIPTRNPDSDGSYPLRWRRPLAATRKPLLAPRARPMVRGGRKAEATRPGNPGSLCR
jgi:hypothetical protein